jgi:hypothetical protein
MGILDFSWLGDLQFGVVWEFIFLLDRLSMCENFRYFGMLFSGVY